MIFDHALHLQKLACGDDVPRQRQLSCRPEIPAELRKYIAALGPAPKNTLETLVDLSMTDDDIARYFRVPCRCISQLREIWNIPA
ncbi:hypothetical protein [Yoonia sp.]|uniref:hypothetical protein n=1 Tax=Yoonia sp. TaxID=2212373 RepID=UPI003F6CAD2C